MAAADVVHTLYAHCRRAGLAHVVTEGLVEVATDYASINAVMGYDTGIRFAAQHRVVTPEEAEQWIDAVEQAAREGTFFSALTYLMTTGVKPFV